MFFSYRRDDVVDDRDASDAGGGGHDSDAGSRSRWSFGCHYPALLYGPVHRLQNTVSVCFIYNDVIKIRFPRTHHSFSVKTLPSYYVLSRKTINFFYINYINVENRLKFPFYKIGNFFTSPARKYR